MYICVLLLVFALIQVVSLNHQFDVDTLTSTFHIASYKYDHKFARNVGLLMNHSVDFLGNTFRELLSYFSNFCCCRGCCVFLYLFFVLCLFSLFLFCFSFFFYLFSFILIIWGLSFTTAKVKECIDNAISIVLLNVRKT